MPEIDKMIIIKDDSLSNFLVFWKFQFIVFVLI